MGLCNDSPPEPTHEASSLPGFVLWTTTRHRALTSYPAFALTSYGGQVAGRRAKSHSPRLPCCCIMPHRRCSTMRIMEHRETARSAHRYLLIIFRLDSRLRRDDIKGAISLDVGWTSHIHKTRPRDSNESG